MGDSSWDDIVPIQDAHEYDSKAGLGNAVRSHPRPKRQSNRRYKPPRSSYSLSDSAHSNWDDVIPIKDDDGCRSRQKRGRRSTKKDNSLYRGRKSTGRSCSTDGGNGTSRSTSSDRHGHRDTKRHSRSKSKSVSFRVESSEGQVSIDESERLAVYLDKAANRIQEQFRNARETAAGDTSETKSTQEETSQDSDNNVDEMDSERLEHIITNIFILLFSITMMSKRWIMKCIDGCLGNKKRSSRRHKNGNNNEEDPEVIHPDEIAVDGNANMQGQPQTGPTSAPAP